MIIFNTLTQLILNTPVWVWVLLVLLIKRGIKLKSDGVVSIKKALIMPSIFVLWGIEKMIFRFSYPLHSMITYLLFLIVGTLLGYFLYSATQGFYWLNGVFMRKGSSVQLWVILINFMIKYMLNVAMNVNPDLLNSLVFNLGYSTISGITVGLFIGGIINTVLKKKGFWKINEYI